MLIMMMRENGERIAICLPKKKRRARRKRSRRAKRSTREG